MDRPQAKTVALDIEMPEGLMPLSGVVCLNCVDEAFREHVLTVPYGQLKMTDRIGMLTAALDFNRRLVNDSMMNGGRPPDHG